MVFLNSQGPIPGFNFAFPDVCNTIVGPAVVPLPYPNFAFRATSVPTQYTCYTMMMPNHNLLTTQVISMGDNVGLGLGVASGLVMGPAQNYSCSVKVFQGAAPVTRMLDVTGQNGVSPNMVGAALCPTQPTVIVLG